MGRHPIENPVRKRSICVSEDFWIYAIRYRQTGEPMHKAMDRMLGYFKMNKEELSDQFDRCKRTLSIVTKQRDEYRNGLGLYGVEK